VSVPCLGGFISTKRLIRMESPWLSSCFINNWEATIKSVMDVVSTGRIDYWNRPNSMMECYFCLQWPVIWMF